MPSITRKLPSGRTRRDAVAGELLRTVERLLDAGESYTALGTRRICEEAGVARSAFYTNFASKSELLLAVVADATESIFSVSRAWTESDARLGKPELQKTMENSIRVWREHRALLAAYFEVSAYDPEVAEYWGEQFETIIDAIERRITSEQRSGSIDPTLDPRSTAQFIVYAGQRMAAEQVNHHGPENDAAVAGHVADIIWKILYGPGVSS
jgi:AcrR family transcriptional regulator